MIVNGLRFSVGACVNGEAQIIREVYRVPIGLIHWIMSVRKATLARVSTYQLAKLAGIDHVGLGSG